MFELTRRAWKTDLERSELESRLRNDYSCSEFVDEIDHNPVNCSFYQQSDWPYFALNAVRIKKISVATFATLMLWYEIKNSFSGRSLVWIPFFVSDRVNPLAHDLIFQTVKPIASSDFEKRFQTREPHFSKEEIFIAMRNCFGSSSVEKHLLAYPDQQREGSVTYAIRSRSGLNLMDRVMLNHLKMRLVVPCTFWQTLLRVRFSVRATIMNYVVGDSTRDDLALNALKNERDVQIPFMDKKTPKAADYYAAYEIDFTRHDRDYHVFLMCLIPPSHKRGFVFISNLIQRFEKNFTKTEEKIWVKTFNEQLIDLECPYYRPSWLRKFQQKYPKKLHLESIFWLSLGAAVRQSAIRSARDAHFNHSNLRRVEELGAYFLINEIVPRLITELKKYPSLKKNFGVDLSGLAEAYEVGSYEWPKDQDNRGWIFYNELMKQE